MLQHPRPDSLPCKGRAGEGSRGMGDRQRTRVYASAMIGKVINLRRTRKQKARDKSRAEADANAARHGEANPVRSLREARGELEARRLEGHRREDADDTGKPSK